MKHEQYAALTDMISELDVPFCTPVGPDHLMFWWPLTKVEIHARHFGHRDGYVEVEVWFHDASSGYRHLGLAPTNVQLTTIQQKSGLLNLLSKWNGNLPWLLYIECVAHKVRQVATAQSPLEEIVSDPSLSMEPEYLLWPLLYRNHPTVIFGSKASAKSLFATVVSYIVQLPFPENKLGLRPGTDPCTVCYADWEDATATFQARWTAIQRGFKGQHPDDLEPDLELPVLRKRMETRLADAVDTLRVDIAEHNVGLLIIDSLGPAAGGDLYAPQSAMDFYAALRSLNVTALILAHHAKDPNKTKSVFGSQFFTILARSVWHAESEPKDNDLIASITETECNLAPKHGTFGFRYAFDNEARTITVTRSDLEGTAMAGNLPHHILIARALLRMGAMTVAEISEATGIPQNAVRTTISRMTSKEQIIRMGKKWAVPAQPQQ